MSANESGLRAAVQRWLGRWESVRSAAVSLLSGLPGHAQEGGDFCPRGAEVPHLVDGPSDIGVDVVAARDEGLEVSGASGVHASILVDSEGSRQGKLTIPSGQIAASGADDRLWLCAKCGHGSQEHGMEGHPAYQCVAEMRPTTPRPASEADRATAGERCRICGGTGGEHDGATHDARVADMLLPAIPPADKEEAK